mmetsp:Transcript_6457/g.26652  ORF Transcript_6457/g.26652 Transcript_6457/m.26652 type:complete len:240 (+) Transcript_6457:1543-2262(+)
MARAVAAARKRRHACARQTAMPTPSAAQYKPIPRRPHCHRSPPPPTRSGARIAPMANEACRAWRAMPDAGSGSPPSLRKCCRVITLAPVSRKPMPTPCMAARTACDPTAVATGSSAAPMPASTSEAAMSPSPSHHGMSNRGPLRLPDRYPALRATNTGAIPATVVPDWVARGSSAGPSAAMHRPRPTKDAQYAATSSHRPAFMIPRSGHLRCPAAAGCPNRRLTRAAAARAWRRDVLPR